MATKKEVYTALAEAYVALKSERMEGYCKKQGNEACPGNCTEHHRQYVTNMYNKLLQEYKSAT